MSGKFSRTTILSLLIILFLFVSYLLINFTPNLLYGDDQTGWDEKLNNVLNEVDTEAEQPSAVDDDVATKSMDSVSDSADPILQKILESRVPSPPKIAVLWRTFRWDADIEREFLRIRDASSRANFSYDAIILFDNTRNPQPSRYLSTNLAFGDEMVIVNETFGRQHFASVMDNIGWHALSHGEPKFWLNPEITWWLFGVLRPHYTHTWALEYDLRYTGDWSKFFDTHLTNFQIENLNLLSAAPVFKPAPDWYWFSASNFEIPAKFKLRTFSVAVLFDSIYGKLVSKMYENGKSAFVDLSITTFANLLSLKVRGTELSDCSFVSYRQEADSGQPYSTFSNYLNDVINFELRDGIWDGRNCLLHPIKYSPMFDEIMSRGRKKKENE